jgi:glycogen(starch) synthase
MKILFWSEQFWPWIGGLEVLAEAFLPALRERGHQVLVVARNDFDQAPDQDTHAGVPIHRFPFWTALQQRDLARVLAIRRRVADLIESFGPDVVHVHEVYPGVAFLGLAASAHPAPLLVALHGFLSDFAAGQLRPIQSTLAGADWVVACSDAVLRDVRAHLPELAPRSSAIVNSLPPPALYPGPLPLDPPRLLCVGRAVHGKGFDLALEAFAEVHRRHPKARLIVAGDGDARAVLEARAVALGLRDAVDFRGWVAPSDAPALIETATLVLVPSRTESFGLVALQAAQMGRPVVATRVGGLPEVVVDSETGLLVEPDSAAALASATLRLLDGAQTLHAMGAAARQRALSVFDWRAHLDAYVALYARLVERFQGGEADRLGRAGCPP